MIDRVSPFDGWLLGFGGWLDTETVNTEEFNLAATIFRAEAEMREAEWEGLGRILHHVDHGRLVWPDDPGDRAALFEDMRLLGWIGGV